MSHNSLVTKPASGHWTDAYPELGRGPVSLEDCVSKDFYEKEREHVFKKTWLYMGRVERVPKSGSYFTRELRFLNTSIIIVRGKDGVIRALHNICPHRGNKMLWEDDPFAEVAGRAPLLYCRFHGWRYKLDGSLHSATRKDLLLDFDAESCRVPAIQCEVWEGFIFVNLNPHNTEPVRSFLGGLAHDVEGYPFDGPHQVYRFKVSTAPCRSRRKCHGTMLEWCSMMETTFSSPGWMSSRANVYATRLIASVALRVKTISSGRFAFRNARTFSRAPS